MYHSCLIRDLQMPFYTGQNHVKTKYFVVIEFVSLQIYDKRDGLDFDIVNFPF